MTNIVRIQSELSSQVGAVLDELGKRFGATGAHLWEVIVKQVYISAVTHYVIAALFVIASALCITVFIRAWSEWHKEKRDDENAYTYNDRVENAGNHLIPAGLVGLLLIVSSIFLGISGYSRMVNPEYFALRSVTEMVRGER